jgi:hypothetical protein
MTCRTDRQRFAAEELKPRLPGLCVLRDTVIGMITDDTSAKANAVYFRRLAEMTPSERLNRGAALCQAGDSLQRAAMRRRYPEANDSEIIFRIAVIKVRRENRAQGIWKEMSSAVEAFDPVGLASASASFGEPRFTNDVDILAEFTPETLDEFLRHLPQTVYADREDAQMALHLGRPFNLIFMPMAWKFDFFPAAAFTLGAEELDRAVFLAGTGLSDASTPFVSPEDILLAKLHWFKTGGEGSEVQWRDVDGILRACG